MGNIKKIFFRDIKALIKNPFAFLIAGGLCIIPALYAWFNIYSNWDPYGNTGNLQIAVATEDKGYVTEKGKKENVSDTVIECNDGYRYGESPLQLIKQDVKRICFLSHPNHWHYNKFKQIKKLVKSLIYPPTYNVEKFKRI